MTSAPVESLLHELERYQVTLRPVGDRLRLRAPASLPSELIQKARRHKAELMRLCSRAGAAISTAVAGLALTADEFRAHLAAEDLEDLAAGRIDARTLRAYAEAIVARKAREGGAVPEGWTQVVVCAGCGPVWLWPGLPERVDGCPWCWNRARGLPVPRPGAGDD